MGNLNVIQAIFKEKTRETRPYFKNCLKSYKAERVLSVDDT